jgi:hypothetical protein
LGDDGILRAIMVPGVEENLETAIANVAAGIEVAGGQKRPLLLDISQVKSMNKQARDYYANSDKRDGAELAIALLVKSALGRVIGNFFVGLNKSSLPTRLFTNEKEALDWLATFLRTTNSGLRES